MIEDSINTENISSDDDTFKNMIHFISQNFTDCNKKIIIATLISLLKKLPETTHVTGK